MPPRRLEDFFKICLEDVFSVTNFRLPRRGLQNVLEDVKLLHWRRAEDVFKTPCRPTNVLVGLLFGNLSFDSNKNLEILNATIDYILHCKFLILILRKKYSKWADNSSFRVIFYMSLRKSFLISSKNFLILRKGWR